MNADNLRQLIDKYLEGDTSLEEEQELRKYAKQEELPEEFMSIADFCKYAEIIKNETSTSGFDPFKKMDELKPDKTVTSKGAEASGVSKPSGVFHLRPLQIAAGILLLLAGFAGGRMLNDRPATEEQITALHQEIQQMKETLMHGGTQSTRSAGKRLSAVQLTSQIPVGEGQPDQQLIDVLVHTMNNDKNTNVRIAAAEALYRFRSDPRIPKIFVRSLAEQEEPMMQITLINILVDLKTTEAVSQMQKLYMAADTPDIVKHYLEEGIAELNT